MAALGLDVKLGQVDDRILPKDNKVVLATNQIRDRFDGREGSPVEILVPATSGASGPITTSSIWFVLAHSETSLGLAGFRDTQATSAEIPPLPGAQ